MQLRKPPASRGSAPHSPGSFTGKPPGRPGWLKDWIASKGKYVLLVCGHKADLNDRGQTTLEGETKGDLLTICCHCWQIVAVERHINWNEYTGTPTATIPDEPLF